MLKRSLSVILSFVMVTSLLLVAPNVSSAEVAAPSTLTIPNSVTTEGSVILSWSDVPDASGYNVYRSDNSNGPFTKVNASQIITNSYEDKGLIANTRYHYKVESVTAGAESTVSAGSALTQPDFGKNVYIFDPTTSSADIEKTTTDVFNIQVKNQFGPERYALLFKPGTYDANVRVGFYTHVAGLGLKPDDVNINGGVTVDADWWSDPKTPYNATQNFWRSVENIAIKPTSGELKYAVSQAASMRRLHVIGKLTLHDRGGWASGGYLADSKIDGEVGSGSQQQWFSRNNNWGTWSGANWNMVFVGNKTAPNDLEWPTKPYTTVDKTPVLSEKPFLTFDATTQQYNVFVPSLEKNIVGTSWEGKTNQQILGSGRSVSLEDFYVAKPENFNVDTVNAALSAGKNLFLTPGVYQLSKPIEINNPNTVVFGLGLATLHANNGSVAIKVADIDGVKIAGVLFEAGSISSPVLLEVGPKGSTGNHAANPTGLYDLYFRVGGDALALADVCIEINSNHVIGDHFWVWRADHGTGAGWDSNITTNGLIVNGNDVTIYGLFVEHFHEYQTLWNGENGRMYFYQCEIPYDVPNQQRWMSSGGTVNGFAGYKVAEHVKKHEAYGLGVYSFFRDAAVKLESAIEVPDTPGVKIHHATSVFLSGVVGSELTHIVNNIGNAVVAGGKYERFNDFTPRTVASITPVAKSTIAGKAPVMPGYVNLVFTDATTKPVPVVWDTIDPSQYFTEGSFTVNGTVGSSTTKAVANVTVAVAPNVPVTDITVTGEDGATTITTKDGRLQMSATITPENADNTTVTWSVVNVNGTVTDKATIRADGLLTALKDGQVKVVATANDGTGIQGEAIITLTNQGIKAVMISVTGTGGFKSITAKGAALQMVVDVQPANAVDKTVTWSVVNETGQATINATGLLAAKKNGTVKVVATANDGSGVKGEMTVTVSGQDMVLGNGWSWVRENADNWGIDFTNPKIIKITTQEGSWGQSANLPKGLLVRNPDSSDFTITTKLNFAATNNYEFAGLLVYLDENNFVSLGRQAQTVAGSAAKQLRYSSRSVGGSQNDKDYADPIANNPDPLASKDIYLKIEKVGITYTGYYSSDGDVWTKVDSSTNGLANPKVGVFTRKLNTAIATRTAEFSNFTVNGTLIPFWASVSSINVTGAGGATKISTKEGTLQMSTAVLPANASNSAVTWSVVNLDGTATDKATISAAGLLTAIKDGQVKVLATANDGSGVTGSLTISLSGQVLESGWEWFKEDPASWSLVPTNPYSIVIRTQPGSWGDGSIKGLLLRDPGTTDFSISTKLNYGASASYEWAGLVIYQDTANAIVFGKQSGTPFRLSQIKDAKETNQELSLSLGQDFYLKIEKVGSDYTAYYSEDGASWTQFGTTINAPSLNVSKVGIGGRHKGPANGKNATYTDFTLNNNRIPFRLPVESIVVTGGPAITIPNGTLQMSAAVLPVIANDKTVTWSVVNEDNSTTDKATISANGLVTAKNNGTVKVVATANDGSGVTESVTIKISGQPELVTSINVTGADEATSITTKGGTLQMSAAVSPEEAANKSFSWSVVNEDGSMTVLATISANGLLTALANGTVKVVATANDGSGVAGELAITISGQDEVIIDPEAVLVTGITVSGAGKASAITSKNGTLQMSAAVLPENASNKAVTWSVYNEDRTETDLATINTTSGLLTAAKDGKVKVVATAVDGSEITGEAMITISGQDEVIIDPEAVLVTGITVFGAGNASAITSKDGTLQMSAAVLPENASNKAVTWSVYNEDGTVTNLATINITSGLLTAAKDGKVKVVATAVDGSEITGEVMINISGQDEVIIDPEAVLVTGITASGAGNASAITSKDGTLQMSAAVLPENASNKAVTWSVYNEDGTVTNLATINTSGLLTAAKDGRVKVVAKAIDGSGITGEVKITISGQVSTGGGSTPYVPPVTPTEPNQQSVTAAELNNVQGGKAVVTLGKGKSQAVIPVDAVQKISNPVEVKSEGVSIVIPSAVFKELAGKLQGNADDSKIIVRIAADSNEQAGLSNSNFKIGDHSYNLELVLIDKDGKETKMSAFSEPVQVRLLYDTSMNKDLLGIYFYDEASKEWQYVGGEVDATNQTITANAPHFSKYAVLEYNKSFSDVSSTHWVNYALKVLAAKHIVTGETATEFKPNGSTTRAEFVAMLVRALGLKATHASTQFSDVNVSAWYAQDIAAAYEAGLITGVSDTNFAPNIQITREQMAILMVRAYEYVKGAKTSDGDNLSELKDQQQVSEWAITSVNLAIDLGLMKGQSVNVFAPQANAIRAETAQAIYNLLNKIQ